MGGGAGYRSWTTRAFLVLSMSALLALQLRTSLLLRELEGREFVDGLRQRFQRNLALFGGQGDPSAALPTGGLEATDDDLALVGATTVDTSLSGMVLGAGAEDFGLLPGATAASAFTRGAGKAPSSSSAGFAAPAETDDGTEVDLFKEESFISAVPSTQRGAVTAPGAATVVTNAATARLAQKDGDSGSSRGAAEALASNGDGGDDGGGSNAMFSANPKRRMDSLAASDAKLLADALWGPAAATARNQAGSSAGGESAAAAAAAAAVGLVDTELATLPPWMLGPQFRGAVGATHNAGPDCLVQRGASTTAEEVEMVMLGVGARPRLVVSSASGSKVGCVEASGGQRGSSALSSSSSSSSKTRGTGKPEISFVLTFKDHYLETENCLASVVRYASECASAEFLVVDDGSTAPGGDPLHALIKALVRVVGTDIKLIRHTKSLGYLQAVTDATRMAKGLLLVTLNNDLTLHRFCLSNMLLTFRTHPQVGLVAPRFVDEGGKVLEAGGIIFNDAKGWSYGRGDVARDQHSLAPFSSVRLTDYGSAACVMVPLRLFLALDLYDRFFLPAYYEDTDMAFQIRHRAGLRVVFQPFSGVTHAESTTYGGKGKEQQKQTLMDNGRRKFHEKWKKVLAFHGPSKLSSAPKNERWLRDHNDVFDHATRLYSFRALFLCLHESPDPLPPRLLATLRVLLACRVHLSVVFVNRNADPATTARLQWLGATVVPLNELVLSQRAALVPCRFDLVYAHSLAAYSAVKATVNEACPAVPPPPPATPRNKKPQAVPSEAELSLTPTVVDVGGDRAFKPRIDALRPADRQALGTATVLVTASVEQKQALQRIIPQFALKGARRSADVIVLSPLAPAPLPPSLFSNGDDGETGDDDLFHGRTGLVVAADLSDPAMVAAVVDFAQRTVQLVASSLLLATSPGGGQRGGRRRNGNNINGSSSDPAFYSSPSSTPLVLHIVPLPSSSKQQQRGSGSSDSGSGHHPYDLPPLLLRLNGTVGAAGVAAATSTSRQGGSSLRAQRSGSSSSSSSSSGGSSRDGVEVEVRLHGFDRVSPSPPSSSPAAVVRGGGGGGEGGGGAGAATTTTTTSVLARVLRSARLHVVCSPAASSSTSSSSSSSSSLSSPSFAAANSQEQATREAVHEAMLAGVPSVMVKAAAVRLVELGLPLVTEEDEDGNAQENSKVERRLLGAETNKKSKWEVAGGKRGGRRGKANVGAAASSLASFAGQIQRLYVNHGAWQALVEGGFAAVGGTEGGLLLRSVATALAAVLKRAVKPNRVYPASPSQSVGGWGGAGGNKQQGVHPPPPRLVARLEKTFAMLSATARSDGGSKVHRASWVTEQQ